MVLTMPFFYRVLWLSIFWLGASTTRLCLKGPRTIPGDEFPGSEACETCDFTYYDVTTRWRGCNVLTNCSVSEDYWIACSDCKCDCFVTCDENKYENWSSWSSCSVTCGGGTRMRSRNCTGADCSGLGHSAETEACNEQECEEENEYQDWSSWSSCSVTCGGGTRMRSRNCTGADCSGLGHSAETEACNEQECEEENEYQDWSSWSSCSVTCGGGTRMRSRNCSGPDCSDVRRPAETESCNDQTCGEENEYQDWSSWSSCSVTCGGGTRMRSRNCTGSDCSGIGRQAETEDCREQECVELCMKGQRKIAADQFPGSSVCYDCNLKYHNLTTRWRGCNVVNNCKVSKKHWVACMDCICDCYVTCEEESEYEEWSSWSCCTVTCGGGTRMRSRICNGSDCSKFGPSSETEVCNEHACRGPLRCPETLLQRPVDCGFGEREECVQAGCCWQTGDQTSCFYPPGQYITSTDKYKYIHEVDRDTFFFTIKVKAGSDVRIALSGAWGNSTRNTYEVILGGSNGTLGCVRESSNPCVNSLVISDLLDPNSFKQFWIKWGGGHVTVGRGAIYGTDKIMDNSMVAHDVRAIGIKTGTGICGLWDKAFCDWEWPVCFPGSCMRNASLPELDDERADSQSLYCSCPPGFKQPRIPNTLGCVLDETTGSPEILTCHVIAEDDTGGRHRSTSGGSTHCSQERGSAINFRPTILRSDIELLHRIPGFILKGNGDYPPSVSGFSYGLQSGYADLILQGGDGTIIHQENMVLDDHVCSHFFGPGHLLHSVVVTCKVNLTLPTELANGHSVSLQINVTGAADFRITPRHGADETALTSMATNAARLCVLIDLTPPAHCSTDTTPCLFDAIHVDDLLTTKKTFLVKMDGWYDSSSGIDLYHLDVYHVTGNTGPHMPVGTEIVVSYNTNETELEVTLTKEPAMYLLVLTVTDRAGNYKTARRLIIHDSTSEVLTRSANPVRTITASPDTGYKWQTKLGPIAVSWKSHFYSSFYARDNMVNFVQINISLFDPYNDDSIHNIASNDTIHIDGIVAFWVLTIPRVTGKDDIPPELQYEFERVTDEEFLSQEKLITNSSQDGDTFTIWIRAEDVLGRNVTESHVIYVDSSPPTVTLNGLEANGVTGLHVHNDRDFTHMRIHVNVFDHHSNIRAVRWSLGTVPWLNDIGTQALPLKTLNLEETCDDRHWCDCPQIGACALTHYRVNLGSLRTHAADHALHNQEYYFSVNVTNKAQLTAVAMFSFLVDASPPVTGYVFDGLSGSPDVDFTQSRSASAYWDGFYDRESGIRFYRYALAVRCLTQQEMLVQETHDNLTFAETTAAYFTELLVPVDLGVYFVTVVAFNNGMAPSAAVCSSGVTVDTTPPVVKEVTLHGGKVTPGLGVWNGSLWIVYDNRKKQRLSVDGFPCLRKDVDHLSYLPTVDRAPVAQPRSIELCESYGVYNTDGIIGIQHDSIWLTWEYEEPESQIHDFKVGISSSLDNRESPDLLGYQNVFKNTHFIKRHSALGHGTIFYLLLRMRNKAMLESTHVIGQVILDETPAVFSGKLIPRVGKYLTRLSWMESDFNDPESGVNQYLVAVGTDELEQEILTYRPVKRVSGCGRRKLCVRIDSLRLEEHDRNRKRTYRFYVRVLNGAGHETKVKSEGFTVFSMYRPSEGVVLDINPNQRTDHSAPDIDYTFNKRVMCARWTGFAHSVEYVNYRVSFGVTSRKPKGLMFVHVGNATSHCVTMVNPQHLEKYHVTVKASSKAGSTLATSDGVIYVSYNTQLKNFNMYDGPDCQKANFIYVLNKNTTIESNATLDLAPQDEIHIGRAYTITLKTVHNAMMKLILHVNAQEVTLFPTVRAQHQFSLYGTLFAVVPKWNISLTNVDMESVIIDQVRIYRCQMDLEYQRSSSMLEGWWVVNTEEKIYSSMTHFEVAVAEDDPKSYTVCPPRKVACVTPGEKSCSRCKIAVSWKFSSYITSFTNIGKHMSHVFSDLDLAQGHRYRIVLRLCFQHECLRPLSTNGVVVLQDPPSTGAAWATALHTDIQQEPAEIRFSISWQAFQTLASSLRVESPVYRWTISTSKHMVNPVIPWQYVPVHEPQSTYKAVYNLRTNIHWSKLLYVVIEGYSPAGTLTRVTEEIQIQKSLHFHGTGSHVYDIDPDVDLRYEIGPYLHSQDLGVLIKVMHNMDLDYVTKTTAISGVMTGSGHEEFHWWLTENKDIDFETCRRGHPGCVSLTSSNKNYHTFRNVMLKDGVHYYTCAHAHETVVQRMDFEETIQEVRRCSNGFTVDRTPPVAGHVHAGHRDDGLQRDTTELAVYWSGFSDVDEVSLLKHASGISSYYVAVGSFPGGEDLFGRTSVGMTTHYLIQELSLHSGHTYYAKVIAVDQSGLETAAISNGLTIDATPPTPGSVTVGPFHQPVTYTSCDRIEVQWRDFRDPESSHLNYAVSVGNQPKTSDILAYSAVNGEVAVLQGLSIAQGHSYFVNVRATNEVGGVTIVSGGPFICDQTPPSGGHVSDGSRVDGAGKEQGDIDFQTSTTHLAAHWTGFEEPESSITIYRVAIGTAILADDIQPFTDVSLDTETSHEATLQSGITYYVTVEACNVHMLCERVSSDGVTVDDSPPVPGSVVIGYGGSHKHYVHSNQNIRAWWHGFHDPHSDIKSYHWCVGTQSGDSCDVMGFKNVYSLTEDTASQLRLPINTPLYVTVKAFNNVGLHVQRSSTPFVVDTSPPVFTEPPKFNLDDVSLKEGTQVDRSQIHLKWSAMDQESGILFQTVTIETHQNGRIALGKMKVGDVNQLSVPLVDEELADGYRYHATVTSCNGAYVCITARSGEVLVDSSGPLIGGLYEPPTFTDTASGSVLNISLQGFSDPHSGVDSYHVRLGLTMGGEELTEGVVTYTANQYSTIQHCVINLTRPLPDQPMYLSVVVKNGVGLYSKVFHVSFVKRDIYEGTVDIIKHSCPVFSCEGHCTCNTVGATCDHVPYPHKCEEVTINNSTLVIKDGWSGEDADLTGSAACLRAHWEVLHLKPVRYEYSIGIERDAAGSGIPGLQIGFWEDVSMTTEAVYCTKKGSRLQHGTTYVFYLRVWLTPTSFAVFQSDGILVDLVTPGKRKRMFIQTSIVQPPGGSNNNNTLGLQTSWTGIFTDEESHPLTFRFSAGSVPGGGDVIAAMDTGTATSFNSISGVLSPGRRFYVTVTAYNRLGFSSSANSHDVIVDTDPPHPGIVYVGSPRRHQRWISETKRLRVCWLGFSDSGSGVRRYEIAIRSTGHNKTYVLPWKNVHIRTDVVLRNLSLLTGVKYEAAVAAYDAAGFSTVVMSKAFEVDITAPCPVFSYEFKKDLVSREPRDWLFTGQSKLQYPYINITDGTMGLAIEMKAKTIHLLQVEAFPPCYRRKSYVNVDTLSTNLDFSESPDGVCVFEMTFMSSQNKIIPKNLTITVPEGSLSILGVSLRTSEVTSDEPISESDAIVLRQMSLTDLMVSWFLVDHESGVMTFQVGLGTNPGGFQLAPLTNRGELTYWAMRNLRISHRMYVYATVIAISRAGRRRAFTSAPYLIDWTPPIVPQPHVRVKPALGIPSYYDAEIEFQGAHDPESHISGCAAALGTSSGSLDVLRWLHVRERNSLTSHRFNYTSGQLVHVTVRCVNRVRLETVVKIDHLVVTDAAPDVTSAQVHLHISSPTSFPARDHVQSYNNTLRVSYNGFKTVRGIDHYLVTLMKGKTVVKSEMNVGLRTDVRLQGLALRDNSTYTVTVRAVNKAGIKSDGVRTNVTVCRASPSIRRENSKVTIKSSTGALRMTWDGVFVGPCSGRLVYQVSAGTRRGSVNLLSPRDTTHAYWEFPRDELASRSNVHVMVKAVAPSGLYTVLDSAVTVP